MADRPTLLLVDDVELFLELERSYLDGCGYELEVARSGVEALQKVDSLNPQLVLMDLYMPGMNGDQVCRQLRASTQHKNIPILMVTAGGKQTEIDACLKAGCNDYITKPVNPQLLKDKVRRLLDEARQQQQQPEGGKGGLRFRERGGDWREDGRIGRMKAESLTIHTDKPFPEGTALEVELAVPEKPSIQLRAKVMRTRTGPDGGMGLFLLSPDLNYLGLLPEEERRRSPEQERLLRETDAKRRQLAEENQKLRTRLEELEAENLDFAQQLVRVEEINNNLSNLYIASSRLHSTLDREEVLEIVKEVVINFIGAEAFALLAFDPGAGVFRYETGEGLNAEDFPVIAANHGPLGEIVKTGEPTFNMEVNSREEVDPREPLAVIPLKIRGELLGALVIYHLLVQKQQLEEIDYQLFSMLGEHAATALFSSTLYGKAERKQKTYREVMDLLLT